LKKSERTAYLFAIGTNSEVNITKGTSTNSLCDAVFLYGKGKSNFVRKGRSGAKQTKSKENCRPVISEAQELVERYYGPVIPQ